MKRFICIFIVLLLTNNCWSQDTINDLEFEQTNYTPCGTYISEDYDESFVEYTGKIVGVGQIHEIIHFSKGSNKVVFRPEESESCKKTLEHMLRDSSYINWYPAYGDYIISKDSIFIYLIYKKRNIHINKFDSTEIANKILFDEGIPDPNEHRELYYSGIVSKDKLNLKIVKTVRIYAKDHTLYFSKCLDCGIAPAKND